LVDHAFGTASISSGHLCHQFYHLPADLCVLPPSSQWYIDCDLLQPIAVPPSVEVIDTSFGDLDVISRFHFWGSASPVLCRKRLPSNTFDEVAPAGAIPFAGDVLQLQNDNRQL
jgi:hypothetical protein